MAETALITGASGGIGYEFAVIMASEGINLVLAARNADKLTEMSEYLQGKYGIKAMYLAADLSTGDAPEKIHETIKNNGLVIDYLVNNAGFGDYGLFTESDPEKVSRMIDLNIKALTRLTQLYAAEMAARGRGKILNVASTAAFQPGPLMAVYYATKAYVLSFTQAVARELENSGVTLTALCPGPTDTGFRDAANLGGSMLFEGRKNASARDVALFGWKMLKKGKRIAVHGLLNRSLVFLVRLLPSGLVTDVVMKISRKKGENR